MRNLISPNVKRSIDMTGGAVNIIVPAGQVFEIMSMVLTTLVTAGQRWSCAIDGKTMYWAPGDANFDPSLGFLAITQPFLNLDLINLSARRIPLVAVEGQTITFVSTDNTGVVSIQYRVHTLAAGLTEEYDGALYGKKRIIFSHALQVTSVGAGLTVDIPVLTNANAPGETVFPWAANVPPDRKYFILALLIGISNTVGTNLTRNGIRLLHEGRELLTPAGIVQTPATVCPFISVGYLANIFPVPYEVNNFEQVQLFIRVTSTDGGAQNASLYAGLLMIEEFLS